MKSILMVAGEASGDLHGAMVVRELLQKDPSLHVYGMGGKAMAKAGAHLIARSEDLSVTGFVEVFSKIIKIYKMIRNILSFVDKQKPSLIILIDCPDFNLFLAKKLSKKGIPIFYYISPQVWAWRRYRVHTIQKYVTKMLVVFPFEQTFYGAMDMTADFVGHPLLEKVQIAHPSNELIKKFSLDASKKTIALMPGSRRNEIKYLLKTMINAAEIIYANEPHTQFVLPLASSLTIDDIEPYVKGSAVSIHIIREATYEALSISDVVMCCSGTATLETAILGIPMVVMYKMNFWTYYLALIFFRWGVPCFALPNLLASRPIVPELIQADVNADRLAHEVLKFLQNNIYRQKTIQSLQEVKHFLGEPGASRRVAEKIFEQLEKPIASFYLFSQHFFRKRFSWKLFRRIFFIPLFIFSIMYAALIKLRQFFYWVGWFKSYGVSIPIISIGNLTLGGTGKTPLTLYLAQKFTRANKKVGIISRGYGRWPKNKIEAVSDGQKIFLSAIEAGDEPRMMAENLPSVAIYVGKDRFEVAKKIIKEQNVDVILLDDGYQHLRLSRSFDFLTIDVTSFWDDLYVVPLGRLREPLTHIRRSHCIVLTRTHEISEIEKKRIQKKIISLHPTVMMIEANLNPVGLKNIQSLELSPLSLIFEKKVFAFCAIGNPNSFFSSLKRNAAEIVGTSAFLDHHHYTQKELDLLIQKAKKTDADYLVTTEKDAVKIRELLLISPKNISFFGLLTEMEIGPQKEKMDHLLQSLLL